MYDPSNDVNDNQIEQNSNLQEDSSYECVPEPKLHLFESSDPYDLIILLITISENPVEIHAHKNILSVASPVFRTMFSENWMKAETNDSITKQKIYLDFLSVNSFMQMLSHMYSDKVTLRIENVSEVVFLANRFMIARLKEICIAYLKTNLTAENCLQIYEKTIFDDAIKNLCINYIEDYAQEIFRTDSIACIQKETLAMIMKLDGLYTKEIDLFKAVHKWTLRNCEVSNLPLNKENEQTIIGDLIYLIRFPLMTLAEFSHCLEIDSNLLKCSDISEILHFFGEFIIENTKFSGCKRLQSANYIQICKQLEAMPTMPVEDHSCCAHVVFTTHFQVNKDIILFGFILNNIAKKCSVVIKLNEQYHEYEINTVREHIILPNKVIIRKFQQYKITIILNADGCLYTTRPMQYFETKGSNNISFKIKNPGAIYTLVYKQRMLRN